MVYFLMPLEAVVFEEPLFKLNRSSLLCFFLLPG